MTPRERRWLLAAIAASLGIRLALAGAGYLVRHEAEAFHVPDSARYLALGQSLASEGAFTFQGQPEIFRLPGFPLIVAAATTAGAPTGGTIVLHALLGALTTWLCFLAGRQIAGTRAGLWAATLYAIEPGQWAWSTMVASETLFTAFTAACLTLAVRYLSTARLSLLLLATAAATGAAYVRFIGYLLPAALLLAVLWIGRRTPALRDRGMRWRHALTAALLAVVVIGTWHVRNGVSTGYWGFSIQLERAAFFMGRGTVDARQTGSSYVETIRTMPGHWRASDDDQTSAPSADTMRREGMARVLEHPLMFASSYAAGIGTALLHPGTAVVMRPFRNSEMWDGGQPSAAQMLTLGRWDRARLILEQKGLLYWLLTIPLLIVNLFYLVAGAAGAWRHRSLPAIGLASALIVYFVILSGGPDGDSRRRVPFVPMLCVLAATVIERPSSRRATNGLSATRS